MQIDSHLNFIQSEKRIQRRRIISDKRLSKVWSSSGIIHQTNYPYVNVACVKLLFI